MAEYEHKTLHEQLVRMKEKRARLDAKIQEHEDFLAGNKRHAILVNYFDGMCGGFCYGNVFDFTYVGDIVSTKYGDMARVSGYDAEKDLVEFDDLDSLGTSRISGVGLSEEELKEWKES